MRVATWNLEWAKPGSDQLGRSFEHLDSTDADVVVTTEASIHDWPSHPNRIDGGADWGCHPVEGQRKEWVHDLKLRHPLRNVSGTRR